MNVVFLLLTTTAAGGTGGPPPAAPAAAVVAPATPCATGGCGAAGGCCDSCGDRPSLLDRIRACFRKCDKPPRPKVCGGEGSGCYRSGAGVLHRNKGQGDAGCCDSGAPAGGAVIVAPGGAAHGPAMHGSAGGVIIPGKVPQGTYATTPAAPKAPAAPSAPITITPAQPRMKLPPTDIKAPAAPVPAPKTSAKPSVITTPVLTPTAGTEETETKRPFEASRRHEGGAAPADFSQVTGRLTYVRADGGKWLLRYASLGHEDANGGGVVLANDRRMSTYRDGDVVTVEGRIIAPRASARFGAPLYQAVTIRLVERPAK